MSAKQLGQLRPADTNAASIYNTRADIRTTVENIIVCNNSISPAKFSIFVDSDGTTFDESTAIYFGVTLGANSSVVLVLDLNLDKLTSNLGVQSDTADALNFTVNGVEITP